MAAKRGRGRPSKYDPERMLPVVRAMAKLGATDIEFAQALQVNLGTIELWARQHPEFLRAIKPPKGVADDRVERSLFKRACGYSYDGEEIVPYDHVETQRRGDQDLVLVREKRILRVPVVKHVPPDSTAAMFWLKNRRKDRWKNFKAVEVSTPPGRPLEIASGAPGEAELIGAYHRRLARAAATAAVGGAAGAHSGADPGVGAGGQGADRPRGDPPADQG